MHWLEKLGGLSQATINTVLALGPFLISQSEKASEAFQRHLIRMTEVDVLRDVLKGEVEIRKTLRESLLEQYVNAAPGERVRIERDLEYADGVTRQLAIAIKSMDHGHRQEGQDQRTKAGTKLIEDHWIDRFNDLARKRNEEWRMELLARALASEACNPGSVSLRALWTIGNLDDKLFAALSELLDLCLWFTSPKLHPFLPDSTQYALRRRSARPESEVVITVGHLAFQLDDLGILGSTTSSAREILPSEEFVVTYDSTTFRLCAKDHLQIRGVLFTPLGAEIARFYDPVPNEAGRSILRDWIGSLQPSMVEAEPVSGHGSA